MADLIGLLDSLIKSAALPERAKDAAGTAKDLASGLGDKADDLIGKVSGGKSAGELAGTAKDVAGDVFGTATDGLKDAAGKLNEATGLGDKADDLIGQVSGGKSASDLVGQAKEMVTGNKAAAGAVLGGLGLLLFGTKSGRGLAKGAAAAGGAALIGGLAYKAFQNHKDGKPLIKRDASEDLWDLETPADTDFAKRDKAHAEHYLRAMISAAAADGKIDDNERARILSALDESELEQDALDFLSAEFATPAAAEAFVFAAEDPELASQIYTAARLAIDPDTETEQAYLFDLAQSLSLDNDLVAHLESAVDAAREQA